MSDWKINSSKSDMMDKTEAIGTTIGLAPLRMIFCGGPSVDTPYKTYTVENTETGEIREVRAKDAEGAGRQIADGNFLDER